MRQIGKTALIFSALTALTAGSAFAAGEYAPGEVIVKYKTGVMRTRETANHLYDTAGVQAVRRYSKVLSGIEHLILGDNVKVQDAVAALLHDPSVEYAQPNYILHALPVEEDRFVMDDSASQDSDNLWNVFDFHPECGIIIPCKKKPAKPAPGERPALAAAPADVDPPVADPDLAKDYGLTKIGAVQAWQTFRGSKNMIVADIDTGIDYNHEDLAFNIWRNPTPGGQNDIVGFDFIHNDGLPYDDNQHGTHTAGTIGAVGGNGKGTSGVAQRVSIMALKFLSGAGSGTTSDAIRAIDYAVNHGAKILSNSWGGRGDDGNKALYEAIERAKTKDVLFIAAAGNDHTDNDGPNASYPAAFDNDNIITVAATDKDDKLAFFSNYGLKTTHVAAPGASIYSTVPGGKYAVLSGTSMACPHVAGAAALVWAKNPTWTYKQVKDALMSTVDLLPALQGKTITGGRINVNKALALRTTE